MHRRAFLLALAGIYVSGSRAAGWSLITREEFQRDQLAPHIEAFAVAPQGVPIIEVEQPNEAKPIKSPVTIRLRFHAQDGAVIDRSSFRVTYGWLAIDITRRILDHAQLSEEGLTATDAELPPGHHRVTLQIADSKRRVAVRAFEFTVL